MGLRLINKNTKIIPGHGELASYEDYTNYLTMLKGLKSNIQKAIDSGKDKEAIIKDESLSSAFYTDEEVKDGFINGPKIRETIYTSLTQPTIKVETESGK